MIGENALNERINNNFKPTTDEEHYGMYKNAVPQLKAYFKELMKQRHRTYMVDCIEEGYGSDITVGEFLNGEKNKK